jgi:methionine-rich copper-binding protein CopC
VSPARLALAGTGALVLTMAALATAMAHAELVSSSPSAGEALSAQPEVIRLTFDGELTDESAMQVLDANFQDLPVGPISITATEMTATLAPVAAGTYTVQWSAVNVDGDRTTGTFSFSVAPGTATAVTLSPTPSPTDTAPPPTALPVPTAAPPPASSSSGLLSSGLTFLAIFGVLVIVMVFLVGRRKEAK